MIKMVIKQTEFNKRFSNVISRLPTKKRSHCCGFLRLLLGRSVVMPAKVHKLIEEIF